MCDANSNCEYEGAMLEAVGAKDVYLYCSENGREYRIPQRQRVKVCPKCGEADWASLS